MREVTCRFRVPAGHYVILPCTFDPGCDGEFLLRIYVNGKLQTWFSHENFIFSAVCNKIDALKAVDDFTYSFCCYNWSLDASLQVTCRFRVPAGHYVILPCTFDPGCDGEFLLRIYVNGKLETW
ncbi:calpain large subunit, domain III [Ostertagia ostertagi]